MLLNDYLYFSAAVYLGFGFALRALFAGDLKFLSGIIGLNGCSSAHPCIYCKVKKALLHLKVSERFETGRTHSVDKMAPRTLEEQIQLAHTPPEKPAHEPSVESCGCQSGASCASGCVDDGCPSYCCPACEKKIGPDHKEPNRLPLPGKTKPGPDDYGVTMRRTVNQKHYGTMLKPLLGLQIQSYIFDILHCKLRVIPQIFKWTVTQNVDAEKLDKVCDKCFSVFTNFFIP
jgi:hypothetical protein